MESAKTGGTMGEGWEQNWERGIKKPLGGGECGYVQELYKSKVLIVSTPKVVRQRSQ
jgi:hypothetical protein